ncbi:MAG: SDR family oxidoreductase, partial [Eubacterium sp.]|nr:SDR family oxidoreductase [Eubacterium sp.]
IMSPYNVSKAAIIMLSACLAKELGAYNVNVNVVNPGFVFTDIYAAGGENSNAQKLKSKLPQVFAHATTSEEIVNTMAMASNMRRMQTAEDMANAVLFLASEFSCNVSGQYINVDAGTLYR